jgi:hypothetical protein
MPVFAYLAVVGSVLLGLLFVADATLEKGTQAVVTSERTGLPKPWRSDSVQTLASAPAPAPDMTSQLVLAAQPVPEVAKADSAAHAARAEAPKKKRARQQPQDDFRQSHAWSRDRSYGPFGGGFFFGRF